jgi:hypothetical protein
VAKFFGRVEGRRAVAAHIAGFVAQGETLCNGGNSCNRSVNIEDKRAEGEVRGAHVPSCMCERGVCDGSEWRGPCLGVPLGVPLGVLLPLPFPFFLAMLVVRRLGEVEEVEREEEVTR